MPLSPSSPSSFSELEPESGTGNPKSRKVARVKERALMREEEEQWAGETESDYSLSPGP